MDLSYSYVILFCLTILQFITQGSSRSTFDTAHSTIDNSSCARIQLTETGDNSHEDAQYCDFPNLWSVEKNQCLFFNKVDCGNRTEPVTPCDYPTSNCSRPEGCNVSICVCQDSTDEQLNYEMCLNKSDGSHVWPARKWSPYYIKCLARRTILTKCSESQMFNFIVGDCDRNTDFINQAFNFSLSSDIPESLLYLITERSTGSDVTLQQTKISDITITPTLTGPSDHPISSTKFSDSLNVVKQSDTPFSSDSKVIETRSSTKPSKYFSNTIESRLVSTIDASSDVFQTSKTIYSSAEMSPTSNSFESLDFNKVRKYVYSDGNSLVQKKSVIPYGLGEQHAAEVESSKHLSTLHKILPSFFSSTETNAFHDDFLSSSALSPTNRENSTAPELTPTKSSIYSHNLSSELYTHSETSIDRNIISESYKISPTPSKSSISSPYSSSTQSDISSVKLSHNSKSLLYSSNLVSVSASNRYVSESNLIRDKGKQTYTEMSHSVHNMLLYSVPNVVDKSLPSPSITQPTMTVTPQSASNKITILTTKDTDSLPNSSLLLTNLDTFVDSSQSTEAVMSTGSLFPSKTSLLPSSTSLPQSALPSSYFSTSSLSSSWSPISSKFSSIDLKGNTVMHVESFSLDSLSFSSVDIPSVDYLAESPCADIPSVHSPMISSSSYSVLSINNYPVPSPTDRSQSITCTPPISELIEESDVSTFNEITPSLALISTDSLTNLLSVTPETEPKNFSFFTATSSNLDAKLQAETSSSFIHSNPLSPFKSTRSIEQSSFSTLPLVQPSLNSTLALLSSIPVSKSSETVSPETPILSSILTYSISTTINSLLSSSSLLTPPLSSIQETYTSTLSSSLAAIIPLSLLSSPQTAISSPKVSSSTTQIVTSTSLLSAASIKSSSYLLSRPIISSPILSSVRIPTLPPISSTRVAINHSLLASSSSSVPMFTSSPSSFSLETSSFYVSALTTSLSSSLNFISSLSSSSLLSSTNFVSQLSYLTSTLPISLSPISTLSLPLSSSQTFKPSSSSSSTVAPSLSSITLTPSITSSAISTSFSPLSSSEISKSSSMKLTHALTSSALSTPSSFSSSMLATSSSQAVLSSSSLSSSSFVELTSSSFLMPSLASAQPSSSRTPMLSILFPSHTDITTHPSAANSKTHSIKPSRTVSNLPSTVQSKISTTSISYLSEISSSSISVGEFNEISDKKGASKTSLIVGLSVGVTVAIICAIVITVIVMRNRTKGAGSNGVRLPPELYISENL